MRVWVNDAVITRVAVGTAVTNGTFDANLAGWTDADEAGARLGLGGRRLHGPHRQRHGLRHPPAAGGGGRGRPEQGARAPHRDQPRAGGAAGGLDAGDDYVARPSSPPARTASPSRPRASFWVEFKSRLKRIVLVDSCVVEAAGAMVVETPWLEADLRKIRHDQSGDIIFVACDGYQQRKIERRATRSWSVVRYQANDGPFRIANTGPTTITPSGLSGNITLTASSPLFKRRRRRARTTTARSSAHLERPAGDGLDHRRRTSSPTPSASPAWMPTRVFTIVITGLTATGSRRSRCSARSIATPGRGPT
jgi:hypothetical protein